MGFLNYNKMRLKVYLSKGLETEVRIFYCPDFKYLLEELKLFPLVKTSGQVDNILSDNFTIFWTDNEGDKVTIVNDRDLNTALEFQSKNKEPEVYKIKVIFKEKIKTKYED